MRRVRLLVVSDALATDTEKVVWSGNDGDVDELLRKGESGVRGVCILRREKGLRAGI